MHQKRSPSIKRSWRALKYDASQREEGIASGGFRSLAHAAAILMVTGVASAVEQLNLSPIFGSVPVAAICPGAFTVAAIAAISLRLANAGLRSDLLMLILPVHASYVPVLSHYFVARAASELGPRWGPLFFGLMTDLPLVFIAVSAVLHAFQSMGLKPSKFNAATYVAALGSYIICASTRSVAMRYLPCVLGRHFLLTRAGLQICCALAYALLCPSWLLLVILPSLIFMFYMNPHMPLDRPTSRLNSTLLRHGFSLLERQESVTGYLSVLQNNQDQFQVLRCDHSLLGGQFLATSQRLGDNIVVSEPIYSVFTMLEAVRLIETPHSEPAHPPSPQSALVIGLGVGTSAAALTSHGIDTTVVEIDPVVSDLASKYFDLPHNLSIVNENAVTYINRASGKMAADFIIHDVFTGGAEPIPLFTKEFLSSLKALLKPEGSIAVNFAGDLHRPSTITIINTIFTTYGSCRLFRDNPPSADAQSDLVNLVVFCRKEHLPWRFREPMESDFLRSQARMNTIPPRLELDSRELLAGLSSKDILSAKDTKVFEKSQGQSAMDHWRVMRKVLPSVIWEMW